MEIGSVQPDLVADTVVVSGSLFLVILCLHIGRSLLECVASLFLNLRHGCCELCCSRIREWRRAGRVGEDSGIPSIEYHEGAFSSHTVNPIVVGELGEWEPIVPVGLSVVHEYSEVLLDFLVDVFRLSVSLGMEGS